MLEITPVGVVVGGRERPFDDDWDEVDSIIRIDAQQFGTEALAGLEDFSHIEVVYVFHLVDPSAIELGARHPRGHHAWPKVGIFAQRAKDRPNRIGVTRCRLVRLSGHDLQVRGLDAVQGTPILDVKPHMAEFDARGPVVQPPWSKELMSDYWGPRPAAAAVLATAWGMQLESVLRSHPPVERYAGAVAVITGQQKVGADHDVFLGERARVSSALAVRLATVPGVTAAIGDVSVPARLGSHLAEAHGWDSAALTPYVLSAGRAPANPDEVVTGYRAALGARLRLASAGPARTVTVVGVARPRHPVTSDAAIFLTDTEAIHLAGHQGQVDAIGVLAAPGLDVARLRAAAPGAEVLTGAARGRAEHPELQERRTTLIPVTAAFGGLAMFIAMFVVASTMGLSIQQREREIALLRAVAATPGQIRRMIAWEATIVALIGSAAGIWPGVLLGRALGHALAHAPRCATPGIAGLICCPW